MLENPTNSSSTANIATVKRYVPPQRNRSLGRRKSGGDRLERANSYANDVEKYQAAGMKNVPMVDHSDPRSSNVLNENNAARLIPLQGCCNSDAYQLLNNRWAAAMHAYENPSTDLAERPVMYSGPVASSWGPLRLPHQMIHSPSFGVGPSVSGSQMDFLSELRKAMHNSYGSSDK